MRYESPVGGMRIFLLLQLLLAISTRTDALQYIQTPKNCGNEVRLMGFKGNFTSPGGYEGYPNDTTCSWFIEAEYNAKIEVTFHDFDLEWSKTCFPYDSVKVSDKCNKSNTWSEFDGHCGNMTSFTVTSRCETIRLEFKSDDSITGKGFNATYKVTLVPKKPTVISVCPAGTINCSRKQVVKETDTARLKCEIAAYPEADVSWFYNQSYSGNPAGPLDDSRMSVREDGSLRIMDLKRSDKGFYKCLAKNDKGEDYDVIELHVKEKCKCPKVIVANWYDIPPYIKDNGPDKEPSGLFPLLLQEILPVCCGNCSEGDGPSTISYANRQENLVAIKDSKNFDKDDTITFPISGKKDDRWYQNDYKFMPLISSPGVAFIVVDEPPGSSANAVFNSVLSGWPVLVLTFIMALLSGIIMWGLSVEYQFSAASFSFSYGDRSPRGFVARIFAIVWVLVGLVITSIFTGVVTTSLTAITLSTDVKLYGTKIAAVANSTEYRLGLNKNAHIKAFPDLQSIVEPLKNREDNLKGVLVDTFVAGEMHDFSSDELRVNKIIDHNSYYGVVFGGGQLSERKFQTCFEDYVLSNQASIFETVKQKTQPMSKPDESAAMERSSDELELLGVPGYDLAKRNLDMMDSLMQEVQEFYENWEKRVDDIIDRHDEEQRLHAKMHAP
ncbi:hypothetical protein OS493_025663 [Desmophyllum pertusum]|uniref:Uncharacterized protein n=1 Tax=Desmophyllum pertusum TaxID=174260 RepID=A0A9W9ZYV1_9CNID|nr:hypothetical protein OS493_025663 [Desmophyllum pertusum]